MKVQEKLMSLDMKSRPDKPASPHLNGKLERSQETDKAEFYATIDMGSKAIDSLLAEWQHDYNRERFHNAHGGKSPVECYFDPGDKTLFSDEVYEQYQLPKERIQDAHHKVDLELAGLKRSLCLTLMMSCSWPTSSLRLNSSTNGGTKIVRNSSEAKIN